MLVKLKPYQQLVFFVVGILLRPSNLVAQELHNTIPNLPSTPIVDIQLDVCPRLLFLPILRSSLGQDAKALPALPNPQVQSTEDVSQADSRPATHELPTFSPELLLKLQTVVVVSSTVVFTEATSLWADPSPDPSGIDSFGGRRVIVSDSEVDEQAGRTKNIWVFDLDTRQVLSSTSTFANKISAEPTDIALVEDGTLMITDDVNRRIISAQFDPAGNINKLYAFDTKGYGSTDPEGVDVFVANGNRYLVTADASGSTIYIHQPGNNQQFDGLCAPGDDTIQKFDTAALGFFSPAGIHAVPDAAGTGVTYYMVGESDRQYIYVVKANLAHAELVYKIDIGALSVYHKMAGLVVLPNTQIALVFRGVDNDSDPNENDGVLGVIQPHLLTSGSQKP